MSFKVLEHSLCSGFLIINEFIIALFQCLLVLIQEPQLEPAPDRFKIIDGAS